MKIKLITNREKLFKVVKFSLFLGAFLFSILVVADEVKAYSCRDVTCCDVSPTGNFYCGDCCRDIEDPCDHLPPWSRRCQDDPGGGGGGGGGGIDLDFKLFYEDETHGTFNNIWDDDTEPIPDPAVRGDMPCGDYPLPPIYIYRGSVPSPLTNGGIYPNECLRHRTTTGADHYYIILPDTLYLRSFNSRVWWSNGEVHDIMSPQLFRITNITTAGGRRTYELTVEGTWDQIYNLYNNPSGGEDYKLKVLLSNSPPSNFEPTCNITLSSYNPNENPVRINYDYVLDTQVDVTQSAYDAPREYSFTKTGTEEWTIQGYNFWENQIDYGSGPTGTVAVYMRYKTCTACGYLEWQGAAPVTNGNPLDTLVLTNDPWSTQIPSDFDPYVDFYYLRIGMASTSISSVNYSARNTDGTPNTSIVFTTPSLTTAIADDWDQAWYRNTFRPVTYVAGTVNLVTEVEMMTRTGDAVRCSNILPVTIDERRPWYQVGGGDLISATGSISSMIPVLPAPGLEFISSDNLGVPIYNGDLNPPILRANIGDPGWKANTLYKGHLGPDGTTLYDYNYFFNKINLTVDHFGTASTNASFFNSNPGTVMDGYNVYYQGGGSPLTILGSLDFTGNGQQKIIIFASGTVTIDGKILLDDGVDFFMIVAAGDILLRPAIGDPAPYKSEWSLGTENLEGVYLTNGKFITNANQASNSTQLIVRGMVSSFYSGGDSDGFDFQRDLVAGNVDHPAEIFQFAPDQMLLFPPFFSEKSITWKEVAPN